MDYFAPMTNAMNAYVQQGAQGNQNLMAMKKMEQEQMLADRQMRLSDLQYNKLKREEDYSQGLRSAYSDAYKNPGSTQVDNPAYSQYVNAATAGPPEMQSPILTELDGGAPDQAKYIYPAEGATPANFQAASGLSPTMQQANTPPDYMKFAIDYAKKNGNVEQAQLLHDKVIADATKMIALNPMGAAQIVANVANTLGEDIKYLGTKDNIIHIKEGETVIALDPVTQEMKVIGSSPKPDPYALIEARSDARMKEQSAKSEADLNKVLAVVGAKQNGQEKRSKPLPVSALKLQQEAVDAIGTASSIKADLGAVIKQIDDKKLNLGLFSNGLNSALNYTGMSTEASRNLNSFKATLEKLRNDSLRLNKGVQTDGDAVRAWKELMDNINDPAVVKQRLTEIQAINERGANLHQANIDNIRNNYNLEPLDTSTQRDVKPVLGGKGGATPPPGRKTKSDPMGIL